MVILSENKQTKEKVAIKSIDTKLLDSADTIDMLFKESSAL